MKVSKTQVKENREKIVSTATELFKSKGYDGIGISELMSKAGFTHGGFYKHFNSKLDLIQISVKHGVEQISKQINGLSLKEFIQLYVSKQHRDHPDQGCNLAALSCDAARQPDQVKQEFENGIEYLLKFIMDELAQHSTDENTELRKKAICILSQSVGAIVLARTCPNNTGLSDEILLNCKEDLIKFIDQ